MLAALTSFIPQAQATTTVSADNPSVHYTFDSDLLDSKSGSTLTVSPNCPGDPCLSASSFGTDDNGDYWTWTSTDRRGGGFTIETNTAIADTYTIALKFSFANHTGWRKIIDYEDRASDNGFYIYNSKLQSYPGSTGSVTYEVNTVLDLVATREATTGTAGTFKVYSVGTDNSLTFLYQYNDPGGQTLPFLVTGTPNKSRLGFFFDDLATSAEATTSGKVYDLRIWSGIALTSSELTTQTVRPSATGSVIATGGNGVVDVSWAAVSGASSYVASALTGSTVISSCTVNSPATTCTITGLANGTSYTIRVQSSAPGGLSTPTAAASPITPQVVGLSSGGGPGVPAATPDSTTTTSSTSTTIANSSPSSVAPAVQQVELPSTGVSTYLLVVALLLMCVGVIAVGSRRLI